MSVPWFNLAVTGAGLAAVAWAARSGRLHPSRFLRLAQTGDARFRAYASRVCETPPLVYLCAAAFVFLATLLGAMVGSALAGTAHAGTPTGGAMTLQQAGVMSWSAYATAAISVLVLLAVLGRRGGTWRGGVRETALLFGLTGGPRGEIGAEIARGLLTLLAVLPVCFGLSWVGSVVYALLHAGAAPPSIAHETLAEIVAAADDPWAWVVATAAVAGAPVIEEFIYRGCLQSGLMAAGARVLAGWKDPSVDDAARAAWPAIIITSVIFTLMHAGNGGGSGDGGGGVPWHALPVLMVLSVVLGMAYARRGVLLTPVLAHAGFNAVNVAAALLISRNG